MILTIKGADFSSANIGTLSTFVVSKSIGRGASFDIPSFVEKNSSVNWVITLDEDYTFGTYSVTMGGDVITPSVVDNVMTISIAEVTGNVRIVVATVNENTGEEEGGNEPSLPKRTKILTIDDIEIGGWDTYEKKDPNESKHRLCTKELIDVNTGTIITIDKPENLDICVTVLKADGSTDKTNIDSYVVRELWSEVTEINVPEDGKLHFIWKYWR